LSTAQFINGAQAADSPAVTALDLRRILADFEGLTRSQDSLHLAGAPAFAGDRFVTDLRYDSDAVQGRLRLCAIDSELAVLVVSYTRAPVGIIRGTGDGLLLLQLRLEGEAVTDSEQATRDARAAVSYFAPGAVHGWRLPKVGPWRTVSIFGTPEAMDARWGLGAPLLEALGVTNEMRSRVGYGVRRPWTVTRDALDVLRALLACELHGVVARAYFEARAEQLVCEFLSGGPSGTEEHVTSLRTRELLERARGVLLADPAHPHTLESLARGVGLSRTVLAEGFRAEFGETVFEFLHRERLRSAWTLLQRRGRKVAAIAAEVGYRDAASFTRAFKAQFGMTPTQAADAAAGEPLRKTSAGASNAG
jgi:AraC-like DNA-binding protein